MAIAIWQPKYSTQEVLVDVRKVTFGRNELFFCCDRNKTSLYSFDGDKVIRECKSTTNGKIKCYAIPIAWLDDEGELPQKYVKVRDAEYDKFKRLQEKAKQSK